MITSQIYQSSPFKPATLALFVIFVTAISFITLEYSKISQKTSAIWVENCGTQWLCYPILVLFVVPFVVTATIVTTLETKKS